MFVFVKSTHLLDIIHICLNRLIKVSINTFNKFKSTNKF